MGEVPKTNAKRIAAPKSGLPDAIANAIIACVVPQGMNMVKAPKIAGAKRSWLLDLFLTSLVKNLVGWITKYLKIG